MLHSNRYVLAALVGLAAILSSCSVKEDFNTCKSQVQLDVRAFDIGRSAFTKAGDKGQDPHRIVFKAFDSSGTVAFQTVQSSGQEGFGALDFELSPGNYTFVAVAHDLSSAALAADEDGTVAASIVSPSEVIMPEALVEDTFCDTLNVTIKPGVPFSAGMTLPRVVSRFEIIMSDAIPDGAKTLKITANTAGKALSGNASFEPSTGLALADWKYVKEADISSAVGKKGAGIGLYLFLTDGEQTINVTVTAYDAEGKEIISHTLENVPMKRNRKTHATGNFFTAGGSGSITFSTEWDPQQDLSY